MLERKTLFPQVIELNFQVGRVYGCNVYLVFDEGEWALIDLGYEEHVEEILETIRQLDFPFSKCVGLIASHADVDHVQGFAKAKSILRTDVWGHPKAAEVMEQGDRMRSFAMVEAQDIDLAMPPVKIDHQVSDGDTIKVGKLALRVWSTPGHTESQLAFRLGNLLFSGDNIYRDGCVGAIDAHHGSHIPSFIKSLRRIYESDIEWLLPAHGPAFRRESGALEDAISRLEKYQHMADFGTCAIDWPLMEEFEKEIAEGIRPT